MRHYCVLFVFAITSTFALSQKHPNSYTELFNDMDTSELFMLGTFHFKDAGLDGYKPKHDVDILSETRQKELQQVLDQIRKFKPTKIAVEWKKSRQARLDSLYTEYLEGRFELKSNEIYQIGFRMGKELGHTKLYAIDAPARSFDDYQTEEAYNAKEIYFKEKLDPKVIARDSMLHERFMGMYAEEDEQKTKVCLLYTSPSPRDGLLSRMPSSA